MPFWRVSRSSARSEPLAAVRREVAGTAVTLILVTRLRPEWLSSSGGSAPAASTPHRGARFAFDAR